MRNELEQEQNKKNLLEAEVKKVRVVFSYMEKLLLDAQCLICWFKVAVMLKTETLMWKC